ncbi:MAG: riboflavin synthase [Bacteroidetes bacterium]|nr:riboflavin synthase [Bacteroidota bacterium]MBS1643102.1 riboflavin synthase [Bacteroidota bacterium]MBS1671831.1 riboflavin synthase [Bacteroidota bacterium]
MFTGIIETLAVIKKIETNGSNKTFWIDSSIVNELKVDQSLAHNGVCLTVEKIDNNLHCVTAIEETLLKTNLGSLKENDWVNIERCMQMNGRLDGHIVQGHVDTTAKCIYKKQIEGSWEYVFEFDKKFASLVIEKGSITVNGISLTCFNVSNNSFAVAIIPYTFEHTNIKTIEPESTVNIEFDMIGKYINRIANLNQY